MKNDKDMILARALGLADEAFVAEALPKKEVKKPSVVFFKKTLIAAACIACAAMMAMASLRQGPNYDYSMFDTEANETFIEGETTAEDQNKKAQEIAEKLMRGRKRVAEQNGQANASIFSQYLSILTVGLSSMSLQELMDLTMFQLYDLVERYQLYISWDIDIKSRLAGAKPDDKPDNWMKNIH